MLYALLAVSAMFVAAAIALLRVRSRLAKSLAESEQHEREIADRSDAAEGERAALLGMVGRLGEGLLAVDRQRRVVLTNRRFEDMFETPAAIEGRPLGEVIRVAAVFKAFDDALRGVEADTRFPISIGGVARKIEIRAMPLPSERIAAVALFSDVTTIERLEKVRRDFISDFSHEVRTPLAGLRSAVESYDIAGGKMTRDDDSQLRRIMTRQLARLEQLVNDLSELSRIESGDLTLTRREADLRQLIDDVCEDFADMAAQKLLRFVITGGNVAVHVDPMRIQQAFANLIDNAIKYGGEDTTIDIAVEAGGNMGIVRITDHGEGIAAVEIDRIFHRFYRLDKSRSQEVAGTGLGLAITKHLVLLHNGSIDVESQPGQGATFIVRLPLHDA